MYVMIVVFVATVQAIATKAYPVEQECMVAAADYRANHDNVKVVCEHVNVPR